jgi:hypothetical protein
MAASRARISDDSLHSDKETDMIQTSSLQLQPIEPTDFEGELVTRVVPCDTMCTEGKITGDLSGELSFRMKDQATTSHPDVVVCSGTVTIRTDDGTLVGSDHVVWNVSNGEFIDYTVFDSGTGCFEGMTGTMTITGTFDLVNATGKSRYHLRMKST